MRYVEGHIKSLLPLTTQENDMSDKYSAGTVAGKFHDMLVQHGLFPQQADGVLDLVVADKDNPTNEVMDRHAEGYPPQVFAAGWLYIRDAALKWIDANCPQHWARPMFLPPKERDELLAPYMKGEVNEQAAEVS
jgi:hypothetical protein